MLPVAVQGPAEERIDPEILKNVKGGSYAYCDADGNYYRSGFGLNY